MFSFDPLNATDPGLGLVAGLHVDLANALLQFQSGVAPFVGILDGSGTASFSVPAAALAPFVGLDLSAVSLLYTPPLLPHWESASPIASVGL